MPNKITIKDIKKQLPPFVTIDETSYKGKRYKARFRDTEYDAPFDAIVEQVIRLQHGCKARGDALKSKALAGRDTRKANSIKAVKAALPYYLTIDESTYRGARYKATFYDTEYNESFERLVCNVVRDGKGYCQAREDANFKQRVSLNLDEVKARLVSLYGDRVQVLEYVNTNAMGAWLVDGRKVIMSTSYVLAGKVFITKQLKEWRMRVLVRDDFKCAKCGAKADKICAHHILTFSRNPERRFDVDNGETLCSMCHDNYHSKYKNEETIPNFVEWLGDDNERGKLVFDRLASPDITSDLN